MTPPRWLREERRAQATVDRYLTRLPIALDEISHRVVRLQLHLAHVGDTVRGLDRHTHGVPEPIRWPGAS